MTITIAGTDRTSLIDQAGLEVQQTLGTQRDSAKFTYKKYGSRSFVPAALDTVVIQDGSTKVFAGRILTVNVKTVSNAAGVVYECVCGDYTYDLDSLLVSETYTSQTVNQIIAHVITNYASGFTYANAACSLPVEKIVFNQVPISQVLKRLADFARFYWYVDPDKDVHFFSSFVNPAPYNLTDTSGNYINKTLQTAVDGTQISNQVKVRGGIYNAASFTDSRTIKGTVTKTIVLPYQFANLAISKNGSSQTLGIDGITDPTTVNVLYNYADASIKFASALADGDVVQFSGNPKVRVLAVASDAPSIATYGLREKIIQDESITDIDTARRRAIAELATFKDTLYEGSFETYTAGLRTGMLINVNSTIRNQNINFLIKKVKYVPRSGTTFAYKVEVVSVNSYTLTDILAKLLQPRDIQADDTEVSEIIKTDIATVTITETITRGTAGGTDTATITIAEVVAKDPLGAGVAPSWVLGDYIPSGTTDTKRVINLDRDSSVLY